MTDRQESGSIENPVAASSGETLRLFPSDFNGRRV